MRILVTGANRGIGLGLTRQLLQRGDEVWATARQPQKADIPKKAHVLTLDVTSQASVEAAAQELSGVKLDVIINNAGVGEHGTSDGERDLEAGLNILTTNAMGPIRVLHAFEKYLHRGSKVLNISSLMGSIADNNTGGAMFYRMSKAALNAASKSLALASRDAGIAILAVHPGWVRTDMGGDNAPTTVDESVQGIVRLMDALTLEQSGKFLDFRGKELPW